MPSSMYFHIIQNLNVPLKRDAHLMSPSKRCVVNVKLVFPRSSLSLFKDPLLDIFELADVDLCKMITCPDEAIICGSYQNLLKLKESPVPVTQWFWLSFQYYLQQIATCQARIIPCLHLQSSKNLAVTWMLWKVLAHCELSSKCYLQLKLFQTPYHFHKSYSYCTTVTYFATCQAVLIYQASFVKRKFVTCYHFFASIQ